MRHEIQKVLQATPSVRFALLFGSVARGEERPDSDVDLAVGFEPGSAPSAREIGELVSKLESEIDRDVDLVVLGDAPPALAWRVVREGCVIFERDRAALVSWKARAIFDYLDFQPVEEACAAGVLEAARRG